MTDQIRIGDVTPRVRYVADGMTSLFSFPFPVFADADLEVYVDDDVKAQEADYTVSGVGDPAGGVVTFVDAPASSSAVTLVRRLRIQRVSDFSASGNFAAQTINAEFDFQAAAQQQVNDDLTRSLRASGTDASISLELPGMGNRAGRVLMFDGDGAVAANTVVNVSAGASISNDPGAADSALGSAGTSPDVSAADHTHPIVSYSDLGFASQSEAIAGSGSSTIMTAVRTAQAVEAQVAAQDLEARDMAASVLAYTMARTDIAAITGSVGKFNLVDTFAADTLAISTNATYDGSGSKYHNAGSLSSTDVVPAMTGFVTSGVTITESGSNASYESWHVFDNAGYGAASRWSALSNSNQWLAVEFAAPVTIAAYQLRPRSIDSNDLPMAPTAFHLDGWNGSDWDVLDNRTGVSWSSNVYKQYSLASPAAYAKYRFYAVSNSSGYEISIGEMELLPLTDPADMTLAPTPAGLAVADPMDVAGYFVFEPVGAMTFGLDVVGRVSIDGGSTFATGKWVKVGDVGAEGRALYRLDADVSAQTGSSLTYEISTANNVELRYHECTGLIPIY